MQKKVKNIVESLWFEYFIIGLIVFNAIILGLETSTSLTEKYGDWMLLANHLILGVFVLEAALKIIAVAPRFKLYFGDGWNLFDFTIVVLSLIPATGEFAMIGRMARLLRVMRLVSRVQELRLIVATLVRSLPGLGNVIILLVLIFYMYAVAGYHLFHQHDPEHWRSLGIALLTLFRVLTLEDWTDVMYTAMQMHPMAWIYFVSFVVIATFIVINMFIAVVINNLEEAKRERELAEVGEISATEILMQIRSTQETLVRLEKRLQRIDQN